MPIDALDDLSKAIVVDVDNAVRTSESELALAVEEFGAAADRTVQPGPRQFASTALAQAFNVRQILDDAVPESPQQRRDLLTRVIVAAAKADQELDAQSDAFEKLRDLIINAPNRLDTLTQQMVDLTARIGPSEQALATLRNQFDPAALTSVADNSATAKERLTFADRSIDNARALVARPAGQQMGSGRCDPGGRVVAGPGAFAARRDRHPWADINRAVAALPAAIADIQNGIDHAATQLQRGHQPHPDRAGAARDAAANEPSTTPQRNGSTDPLGTFTRLTKADADLDRLLASVAEERAAVERMSRSYDQALLTAQSRVRGVSDFIDTRRGSIGPEARTRLAEAVRQLQAAQDKKATNLSEAIAHANGASMLAAQAQSLANDDVRAAQQTTRPAGAAAAVATTWARSSAASSSATSSAARCAAASGGGGGGFGGGRSTGRPTSFGGSSRSSGRSYSGGGGRF